MVGDPSVDLPTVARRMRGDVKESVFCAGIIWETNLDVNIEAWGVHAEVMAQLPLVLQGSDNK